MNNTVTVFHQVNFPFFESGTNFFDFLHLNWQFVQDCPQILGWLRNDQDRHGLKKKARRRERHQWEQNHQACFVFDHGEASKAPTALAVGRPRMDPLVLWTFLQIEGYYGSFREQKMWDFCCESSTLRYWLQDRGLNLPGRQTIIDNINAIRSQTLKKIHVLQMDWLRSKPLDEEPDRAWETILLDSTAVSSKSRFGNDSSLAAKCLERIVRHWEKVLEMCGCKKPISCKMKNWQKQIKQLDYQINAQGKKKNAKKNRRRFYRQLIHRTIYAIKWVLQHLWQLWTLSVGINHAAKWLLKERVLGLIESIQNDLNLLKKVTHQANERILRERKVDAGNKVLSLSDPDAAMIIKGGREPVLGYKVHLCTTAHGFISALDVESGNPADSTKLTSMIKSSNRQIRVKASQVSVDDGYSSARGLKALQGMGVKNVSISGSKGKKLLGDEHWDDEQTAALRQMRPAIEASMFVIKHRHGLDRMGRYALEGVKQDLWKKVLAFNMVHYLVKKRQEQKKPPGKKAA